MPRCRAGRATGPAERATRADHARRTRTANVRPTPLHGTSTRIATNRESCSRPEMSCAKVQKERLPLASRVSNVKLCIKALHTVTRADHARTPLCTAKRFVRFVICGLHGLPCTVVPCTYGIERSICHGARVLPRTGLLTPAGSRSTRSGVNRASHPPHQDASLDAS